MALPPVLSGMPDLYQHRVFCNDSSRFLSGWLGSYNMSETDRMQVHRQQGRSDQARRIRTGAMKRKAGWLT